MTAVTAADLVETLKGKGLFTVFVPTDEAFTKLPAGTLDNLLEPETKEKLKGILAQRLVAGKVMVDNANVVQTNVAVGNGVIQVIDAVVLFK